jgi:hypothetical protein
LPEGVVDATADVPTSPRKEAEQKIVKQQHLGAERAERLTKSVGVWKTRGK